MAPATQSVQLVNREEQFSLATVLVITLFFSLTLLFFGPTYIYFTNSLEFNFSFLDIAPWLLGAVLVITLLLMILIRTVKSFFYKQSISLLFSLSLLLWIQGNLLVWHYGPLDGREIHWNEKWYQGLLDGGLWALLIVFAIKKSGWIYKISRKAAAAFIIIQLISVSLVIIQAPEIPSFKRYYIDESEKFLFSTKKNIIILLLDTFQSDFFQEIINENNEYKDIFNGFTYFRNTLSGFSKTYGSVPSILTSRYYDNSIPMQEFLKEAYTSKSSLLKILKERDYRVEVYPYPHTEKSIYFNKAIISNIKKTKLSGAHVKELGLLLDITLFRYSPHFLKRYIYNNHMWFLKKLFSPKKKNPKSKRISVNNKVAGIRKFSKKALQLFDIQFIDQMLTKAAARHIQYTFKYFHLNGLHRPLILDKNLDICRMPYNKRESFKKQATACLEITRLFLEKLKKIGQYDKSLIFIIADHGCADYTYGVNVGVAGFQDTDQSTHRIPAHIKAAGLPLVLVKPIGSKGEMKISDAPVSLSDVPKTIFLQLEIEKHCPETGMFEIRESDNRERKFYYYNWNGWSDDYFYHMKEYTVSGHAWLDESWVLSGTKRPATSKIPYEYGSVVRFGNKGNATRFQGIGWHGPQKGLTWTREKKAELFFTIKPPSTDVVLELELIPYLVPGKLDKQIVHIYVNGTAIKTIEIFKPSRAHYKILIPKRLLTSAYLNILFDIPSATPPVNLNIGNDVRSLGVAFKTLTLTLKLSP